ncbi:hypothetical protein JKP88DRAFT_199443 [Tribonema minus]|uniref:Uncharacterized protein n=1 Tax=Tribonema minus TaxID=303371 RepID=A0A835YVL4_9STRA|nr:hypothetical protein JKP88DRAFT_199443 [Tribonema minus]
MALNLSQAVQGAVLRVAASTPLGIPNALGFVTVAGASLVALHVSEAVSTALTTGNLQLAVQSTIETASDPGPAEASAVAFGLALFKCLGGTFGGIAPSLIDNLGAFSRFKASLPATLLYATTEERGVINALGETYGCHSCGRRAGAKYNADHMPPLKYVKKANARLWRRVTGLTVTQRFYPQCKPCSDIQAQVVRADGRFVKYHHPLTVHRYHATGLLLVAGVLCLREYARERTARAALRKAEK